MVISACVCVYIYICFFSVGPKIKSPAPKFAKVATSLLRLNGSLVVAKKDIWADCRSMPHASKKRPSHPPGTVGSLGYVEDFSGNKTWVARLVVCQNMYDTQLHKNDVSS